MTTDTINIRLVISGLIAVLILCILAWCYCGVQQVDASLPHDVALSAIGALAAILATTRSTIPDPPANAPVEGGV